MRLPAMLVVGICCLILGQPEPLLAAPAESNAYHIVLSRRALGAGESVELQLVPPPPAGARVNYSTMNGAAGIGLQDGIYRAPFIIAPGTPPVRVTASFSEAGVRATVTTEIELVSGSVPGAEDCLGPGQSFSTVTAGIEPSYLYLDELPVLIHSVEPEYPRSRLARAIEDTIPVRALVCRSGRVLDAFFIPSFRGPVTANPQPIERDPMLVDAALAAVRQYVFSPGRLQGQAVAVWVDTVIIFRR